MLLGRGDERLDDVDVALAAVGEQLGLEESLLKRLISAEDSGTPSWSQIWVARPGWALPEKTTISRMVRP